jgi:hypothetical protein
VSGLALVAEEGAELTERLVALVRPEFAVARYHPAPDDPVLGAPACRVARCERPATGRALCAGHLARWGRLGRPDFAAFAASTPLLRSSGPRVDEFFDLSPLAASCRLELAYVLQRRHDERGRGLRPPAARPVVATLARAGASSLLERPVEEWLSLLPPGATTTRASAIGFLRYAFRELEALAAAGVEAEYARDAWDARRLGVPVTVGHHRVSFEHIPQRWLREPVKAWARSRLVGGMSFGAIRRDVTGLSWFGRFLASSAPPARGPAAGHASPQMTATYARLHDATVRREFEAFCATRVDADGRPLPYAVTAPTSEAEWVKHHLSRIQASLPNGFCGRPPKQGCPHPNACLTCPDFQTSVQFLPVHRAQADETRTLLRAAEQSARARLAENHRAVLGHLEAIIDTLEGGGADGRT